MSSADSEDEESSSEPDFRDERLHDSLSDYVERVTNIVDNFSDKGSVNNYGRWSTLPESPDSDENPVSQSDAADIVERISKNWEIYPKYDQCKSAFDICDVYEREAGYAIEMGVIDNTDEKEKLLKEDTLPKFFRRYIVKNGGTGFNQNCFDETYVEFEEYLTNESVKYRSHAVLIGFDMDQDEITLDDDLRIIRMDTDRVLSESRDRYPLHPRVRRREKLCLVEKIYETDKFEGERGEEASETFDNVLLALHMFECDGNVGYTMSVTEPTSLFHENTSRTGGQSVVGFFDENYHLSESDVDDFVEFWDRVGTQIVEPPESFRIALDKFSNSFQRTNQNDRLLDLVITLEAMYLKEGEAQEMSYRLSQRGALFVGDSKTEALEIKDSLKDSYNKRSTLVHGGFADTSHDEIIELHEFTRKSLATFLRLIEDGENHKELLRELDEKAVTPPSES